MVDAASKPFEAGLMELADRARIGSVAVQAAARRRRVCVRGPWVRLNAANGKGGVSMASNNRRVVFVCDNHHAN